MNILGSKIIFEKSVGGGCIAQACLVTLEDGRTVFVKSGTAKDSFQREAHGLQELAKANAMRVPEVLEYSDQYLVLECIKTRLRRDDFFEYFGRQFAKMHRYSSKTYGFYEDNYIGSTPQINKPAADEASNWPLFFWNKRLNYQFRLAEMNGYADKKMIHLSQQLAAVLPDILNGSEEAPSLLHGDLWSGNYMVDEHGNPVLIDPAVYYGHREADLAMTKLFGGFPPSFYAAYLEIFPLKEGWEYRENMYKLYHVLNHLNLFGSGYYHQAIDLIRGYV